MAVATEHAAQEYRRKITRAKRVVRNWEAEYTREHNEKPDRTALKVSPEEVRDAYKIYWKDKMKNSLSNTSCDSSRSAASPLSITSTETGSPPRHNLFSSQHSLDPDYATSSQPSWGTHLNKLESNKNILKAKSTEPSLYVKMAENLRSGCIIKTRKSLNKRSSMANNSLSSFSCKSPAKLCKNSFNKTISTSTHPTVLNSSPNLNKVINSPLLRKVKPSSPSGSGLNNNTNSPLKSPDPFSSPVRKPKENNTVLRRLDNTSSLDFVDELGCMALQESRPFRITANKKEEFNVSRSVNCVSAFNQLSVCKKKVTTKPCDKNWLARCEDLGCDEINTSDSGESMLCATPVKNSGINILKRSNNSSVQSPAKKIKLQLINKYDNELQSYSEPVYHKAKRIVRTTCEAAVPHVDTATSAANKETVPHPIENLEPPDIPPPSPGGVEARTCGPYDELCDMELKENTVKRSTRKYLTKEERLTKKIQTGSLDDNYVRINIEKKTYTRGKKHISAKNYKHKEWKKKQAANQSAGGGGIGGKRYTCFRCGDFGHFAQQCPGKMGDNLMPADDLGDCDGTFLTLDQAAKMSKSSQSNMTKVYLRGDSATQAVSEPVDSVLDTSDLFSEYDLDGDSSTVVTKPIIETVPEESSSAVPPLYSLRDGELIPTPKEVLKMLKLFGHNSFKDGQEKAIMRILSGLSTLLVLSTGSGKSLCYQLPAYLLAQKQKCVALCISPLVSLMEDQVTGLPACVKAVCLHTQQNAKKREKALELLKSGGAHILIVSPEAITSSHRGGVLGTLLRELPPISFACIDEAHCISQWSDNFRPAYLQVCKVLQEKLHVNTILALTATAKHHTAMNIADHIGIKDLDSGIIASTRMPSNLNLSVSLDTNREEAILQLLTGDRFGGCFSIIIYCTRREQCDKLSAMLRIKLLKAANINVKGNQKRGRTVSSDAEAYHAGLSAFRRGQVQKNFMSGNLRIVVATVAFGMGIDKSDVRGIIHYNMPQNIESYVQEIGRAGRDGRPAHAHLFLDPQPGADVQELKRHIFSNSVDHFTLRKLLNKVLAPCPCDKINNTLSEPSKPGVETVPAAKPICPHNTRELAIPVQPLIEELDIPEENIKTLLCYLELYHKSFLKVGHHVYSSCSLTCYKGPKQLCLVSRKCPPLAAAIALQAADGVDFGKKSSIQFPVVEVAAVMGWNSSVVKQELKKLEWEAGVTWKKTGVNVEFSELAFHLQFSNKLSEETQDELLDHLYTRATKREKDQLQQLLTTYKILHSVSYKSSQLCSDEVDDEKSESLKAQIKEYFGKDYESVPVIDQLYIRPEIEERIRSSVRGMVSMHREHTWNGRAIARIFHGISSPNYPAHTWGRVKNLWRLYLEIDFNLLISLATKELLKLR